MKKLIGHDFVRFCIVGAIGFAINFVLLTIFYKILGWNIYLAQLISGEAALFGNFLFHHNWTYKNQRITKSILKLVLQFHVTSWAAIIGTALIVGLCVNHAKIHYTYALVIGAVTGLVWNYIWTKFYVWRHNEKPLI